MSCSCPIACLQNAQTSLFKSIYTQSEVYFCGVAFGISGNELMPCGIASNRGANGVCVCVCASEATAVQFQRRQPRKKVV